MWNPFARETRVLHSNLAPESCRERLRAETGSTWNPFSSWNHPVRGWVTEKGFCILKSIRYKNSLQTEARGLWTPEGNGTRIDVSLGLNRFVAVAMVLALILVAAAVLLSLIRGLPPGSSSGRGPEWLFRVTPLFMLALIVVATAFARWLARDEARELIAFLSRTLECQPDGTPVG